MSLRRPLLALLADLDFHSGSCLARALRVSRAAVWKTVHALRELGVDIESRHGKGYRLLRRPDLLEEEAIRRHLDTAQPRLELHTELPSTNLHLLELLRREDTHARVTLCEYQSRGRGRRGRSWVSPFASGLCLSIAWRFTTPPASLNALSLACGVALARTLRDDLGVAHVALKWPNDVIAADAKLAGILIESRSETATSCDAVIGIGLNIELGERHRRGIEQAVTDLSSLTDARPSRNRIAAAIINRQFAMLNEVARDGPAGFVAAWREFDCLAGKRAVLDNGGETVRGLIRGVDDNGLLLMKVDGVEKRFSSGEVTARGAA